MRRARDTRARALPALLFSIVWVLGYEVTPLAHQSMHAWLPQHEHCHAGFCHEDSEPPRDSPATHGSGSLEHRGVAALPHSIVVLVPELVAVGVVVDPPPLTSHEPARWRVLPPGRGPPAA